MAIRPPESEAVRDDFQGSFRRLQSAWVSFSALRRPGSRSLLDQFNPIIFGVEQLDQSSPSDILGEP